jgi:hypothetical protein
MPSSVEDRLVALFATLNVMSVNDFREHLDRSLWRDLASAIRAVRNDQSVDDTLAQAHRTFRDAALLAGNDELRRVYEIGARATLPDDHFALDDVLDQRRIGR